MEKRTLLAIVLSIAILLGYNYFVSRFYPIQKPSPGPFAAKAPALPQKAPVTSGVEIRKQKTDSEPISLVYKELETANLKISFTGLGGSIAKIYLKEYRNQFLETHIFDLQGLAASPFQLAQVQKDKISFVYEDKQKRIVKAYLIHNNFIELELMVQNLSAIAQNLSFNLNYFSLDLEQPSEEFKKNKTYLELAISLPDRVLRKAISRLGPKDSVSPKAAFNWIGLKDRYFCTIFKPESTTTAYYLQVNDNKELTAGVPISFDLPAGASGQFKVKFYAGPLRADLLNAGESSFVAMVNFGVFDPISKGLLFVLRFSHNIIPNWGFCIIFLSCLLFFLLYPLTLKSLKSMKAMQSLQPEIEKLRKELKDQPQKLNAGVMELYKKNKVNPFGGCLPMILQIPIFIALYQALLRSLEIRSAGFLWIKDLSEPDRLFTFASNLPVVGNEFNLLPILMAIIMFLQQKFSSQASAAVNPDQQKLMLIFFPILFGFMFYHLASGLVLYWFIYSGLSLVFQWKQLAAPKES